MVLIEGDNAREYYEYFFIVYIKRSRLLEILNIYGQFYHSNLGTLVHLRMCPGKSYTGEGSAD